MTKCKSLLSPQVTSCAWVPDSCQLFTGSKCGVITAYSNRFTTTMVRNHGNMAPLFPHPRSRPRPLSLPVEHLHTHTHTHSVCSGLVSYLPVALETHFLRPTGGLKSGRQTALSNALSLITQVPFCFSRLFKWIFLTLGVFQFCHHSCMLFQTCLHVICGIQKKRFWRLFTLLFFKTRGCQNHHKHDENVHFWVI